MTDIAPLGEREHTLLLQLAVLTVARHPGGGEDAAREALGQLAERGEVVVHTPDGENWYLLASGNVIVHASRAWLAGHTNDPGLN